MIQKKLEKLATEINRELGKRTFIFWSKNSNGRQPLRYIGKQGCIALVCYNPTKYPYPSGRDQRLINALKDSGLVKKECCMKEMEPCSIGDDYVFNVFDTVFITDLCKKIRKIGKEPSPKEYWNSKEYQKEKEFFLREMEIIEPRLIIAVGYDTLGILTYPHPNNKILYPIKRITHYSARERGVQGTLTKQLNSIKNAK